MNRLHLLAMLIVATTVASAQPWSFSRIPNPPEQQLAYTVRWQPNVGYTVGATGVVRWTGGEQTSWTFSRAGNLEVCGTIDADGNYVGLLRGRMLVRVQGDSLLERPDLVFSTAGTAMGRGPGDAILLSRPHATLKELYVYTIHGMEIVATDTLNVDSVVATRLYQRPTDNVVFLSARHVVDADTVISTWALTVAPFPWQPHNEAIWGDVAFFGNGERAVVPDSIERAAIVAGNTIIGMKGADRARRWAMYRSTDGGVTYHPLPGLDTLRATVTAHGTWFDSTLACATSNEIVVITADGAVSSSQLPQVEQSVYIRYLELFPGRTDVLACGDASAWTLDHLYDVAARRWEPMRALIPDSLRWYRYYVADRYLVISDSLDQEWRLDPVTGQNTRIEGDSGVDIPFADGFTRGDGRLWLSTNDTWYEVAEDGKATRHRLVLPRYESGSPVSLYGLLEGSDRSMIVGTRVPYREGDSSKLVPTADLWGVLRTTDNGQTWTMHNDGLDRNTSIWGFARASDGVIYLGAGFDLGAGATRGEVYRSTDDGRSWTQEARLLPATIKREFQLRTGPEQELLVIGEGLVYRRYPSIDWYTVPGPWGEGTSVYDAMILPGSRQMMVVTAAGLYLSDAPVSVHEESAVTPSTACTPTVHGRTIHLPSAAGASGTVVIADLLGRVRLHQPVPHGLSTLDVPNDLERGIYLVSVGDCRGLVWIE